jgi:hypothetical protein
MRLVRSRPCRALLAAAGVLTVLALPASASALTFHIVNESGLPAKDVFVNVTGEDFDVPGFTDDAPVPLESIPGGDLTINKLISGRVYISYHSPVREAGAVSASESADPKTSTTRFDWTELTLHGSENEEEDKANKSDVANLTAVEQFAIGMRLTTFGAGGEEVESIGSTNADTIFNAMQGIAGGPESTVSGNGEILRVLSPTVSAAYPQLTEYVHSMAGQTITVHTDFDGPPFVTSEYSGTFAADGSITLNGRQLIEGAENPHGPTISFEGPELIKDIYTGEGTPNNFEGTVRRDVLAGFSLGLWGGRYGNDALSFCTNPNTTFQGTWCPNGFNVPAFAESRTSAPAFPYYEGYASVIGQYGDVYGNPYSDASKKVQISLARERASTLQLTILPDSPPASTGSGPSSSSSSSSSSGASNKPAPAPPLSQAKFKLAKVAKFKHGKLMAGGVQCKGACGRVVALLSPVRGKGLIAREAVTARKPKAAIVLKPTKSGKKLLDAGKAKRAQLTVTVTQPGHSSATKTLTVRVVD